MSGKRYPDEFKIKVVKQVIEYRHGVADPIDSPCFFQAAKRLDSGSLLCSGRNKTLEITDGNYA
jgi:hypothetical protein